ncbi:MAG TPA: hypothetical protein VHV10_10095 [Ktedonobacteraceae bacterium]|nr:hypothetical protein [Ktedonobacteraceae bacterium]
MPIFDSSHKSLGEVTDAPTEIFKAAVLALAPHWADSEIYGPLLASPEDLAERWFLLCGLCEAKRAMRLYASREEAEQAVRVVVSGAL